MKKRYLLLVLLLGFFFIPKNTFAQSITPSYTQIYWQAYPYSDSSDVQNSAFESSQNQLYLWGSSFADFHLNRNGLLVTYPTLGASTYQYKVRFYIATNTNYIGLNKKASCNLWSPDIYNQSCSVDGSGITTDISGGGGYTTHYVDISYNFSTYGSNYVEFWIWYDNMKLTPKLTKFGYKILSFEGQIDPTSIIVDQNTTIINNGNKTNEKLDEANQLQKETQEEIKKQTEEQKKTNDTLKDDNTDEASTKGSGFFNSFTSESHGLSGIVTAPLQMLQSLTTATCKPLKFKLPFVDNEVTLPCMRSIYEQHFGVFFTLWQTITTGLISYNVCLNFYKKINEYVAPLLCTTVSKPNLVVANSYDTFETIKPSRRKKN